MSNPVTEDADDMPSSVGCPHNHETEAGRFQFMHDLTRHLYLRVPLDRFLEPVPPAYLQMRQQTIQILQVQPSPRAAKQSKKGDANLINLN
uniref:BESS domain-containing protein n=1 Tax=Panagrellus redivivus TaxID=6233 RepID=A0A7E4WC51_PANRE